MSGPALSTVYEIRVEGVLDQRWTAWFEGLEIASDDSQTIISGRVADQAALHGLLAETGTAVGRTLPLGRFVVLILALLPGAASAQQRPAWNGAFTAAQAGSGQQIYREECMRCHGATLTGGAASLEIPGSG